MNIAAGPQAAMPVDWLEIDAAAEVDRIVTAMRRQLRQELRRRGLVLGLSGGIDSSVCAALAAKAVGPANVLCVMMPERDSDPESLRLGQAVADVFGLQSVVEDIGPMLDALGCYRRRDEHIRSVIPEFGAGWGCKMVLASPLEREGFAISSLVVESPSGERRKVRLPAAAYLGIVAATNMKQRTRKQIEYHHADRLNFAVIGTPNRLEYDQGFFVKNGDGAADLKPIAHLYKSQVYALAAHLRVPSKILARPPTTDTWSLSQTQDEFYFALPHERMDLCLYGLNNGIDAARVGAATGLSAEEVGRVWQDIEAKRRATRYLHQPPLLVEAVGEIG